jgi:predicted alpha/beta hydrolase family esterase
MKKVYIIHGWEGSPTNNWFPWLKGELESKGFEVIVPSMPEPESPHKLPWTKTLQDLIPDPDENVIIFRIIA